MALLVRINASSVGYTEARRHEFQKYIRAMNNNFPDLLRILTSNEKRQYFRNERLPRPRGIGLSNLPMVGIGSDLANESVNSVMKKLLKALHYRHTGHILPRGGSIELKWITNAYLHTLKEDQEFIGSLTGVPTLTRNGTDLSSQFSYRYGIDLEKLVSAFVIVFRNSLIGIGIVAHDERIFQCEADQAS
ncbi:hypothetical protein [Nitrobacter sp. Nb-311A]|uniref:hypothetical protein n=1 Tax=Nitrobacter sp. Nb-311A TaxID=314253 RepID=UPI001A93C71A|nr:hypothetical protein [Nitrobacter sp. Nb-311A]